MEKKENCQEKSHWRHNCWRCVGFGVLGVLGFIVFVFIAGVVIMWLWNCLVPQLFHLTMITFWQAVGLAVLFRLLFGVSHFGWHHRGGRRWKHSHCNCGDNCSCGCGSHSHHHSHEHGENECGCGSHEHNEKECGCHSHSDKWQYYEQFWEEEGEKAFQEYVKRKSENT